MKRKLDSQGEQKMYISEQYYNLMKLHDVNEQNI